MRPPRSPSSALLAAITTFAAASALSSGGCVYLPTTVALPNPKAAPVATASTHARVSIVTPFVDARRDRGRCGMKKNGYNGDSGDVLCSEAPAGWIGRRLVDDLRAAGVEVLEAPRSSDTRIEGQLLQLFSENKNQAFSVDQETDIHVRLTATFSDGLVVERDIYVKGVETSSATTDEAIQTSLDDASQKVSRAMLVAVLTLLEKRAKDHVRGTEARP